MMNGVKESTQSTSPIPLSSVPQWVWWTVLAILATLTHTLIDAHIGLWGETSDEMSVLQAANIAARGIVYAWWFITIVFAFHGDRWALRSVFLFATIYAFFLHGLVAFIVAPPPSSAFPYQDIAHGLSFLAGGIAAITVWPTARGAAPGGKKHLFIASVALILMNQLFSSLTFFHHVPGS